METQEKKGSVVRGNEQCLPLREAARLVERCSQKGIAVIGIDFVHIRKGTIYPQIPINSADWSVFLRAACWQDAVTQCNAASLRVLEREEREDPEQLCSFVFFTEEEWVAGNRSQPELLSGQRKTKSMSTLSDELSEIAGRLDAIKARDDFLTIKGNLSDLTESVETVDKAWSRSWLGYQACVYYLDLQSPPAGAHFSQEWGLRATGFSKGTTGDWVEYEDNVVCSAIYKKAGNPDMRPAEELAETAKHTFEDCKAEALSLLTTALEEHKDSFLTNLKEEAEKCLVLSKHDFIKRLQPSGQFSTLDTLAAEQNLRIPPHIAVLAEIASFQIPLDACEGLSKVAKRAASHLTKRGRYSRRTQEIGTNVFIGHGRSLIWKDLKDFIQDKLKLPWDEFNRVPVAGVTNVERLSQMLNDAAIAFLVMTAEDDHSDGTSHARENVVHEAGLFQGKLGFSKAIILLEEGCKEFSNIQGLGQIRFPPGKIKAAFEEVREVLEREDLLDAK